MIFQQAIKSGFHGLPFLYRYQSTIYTEKRINFFLLLYNRGTMSGDKKMSVIAFIGGLIFAIGTDLIGILLPVVGTIFIGFMSITFWIAGYNMRGTLASSSINAILETLPVVPCCTIFMITSFVKNGKNVKGEAEKKATVDKKPTSNKVKWGHSVSTWTR